MSEQIQDQISAFVDDELSAEECAFLVRRLERDPRSREQLIRYTTVGAVLRGEHVLAEPTLLRRRLQEQLNGAAAPVRSAAPQTGRQAKWLRPAVGAGIAASVAAMALFALKAVNDVDLEQNAALANQPAQAGEWSEPASYVVPQEPAANRIVAPPIRLTNYLIHHSEYASRLSRTSVHSNVVGTVDNSIVDVDNAETNATEGAGR